MEESRKKKGRRKGVARNESPNRYRVGTSNKIFFPGLACQEAKGKGKGDGEAVPESEDIKSTGNLGNSPSMAGRTSNHFSKKNKERRRTRAKARRRAGEGLWGREHPYIPKREKTAGWKERVNSNCRGENSRKKNNVLTRKGSHPSMVEPRREDLNQSG